MEADMKATIVDLRYKMKDVLKALDRNEAVTVLYHGKTKAIIVPAKGQVLKKIQDHPFFGMSAGNSRKPVLDQLDELRKPRYNDI
jgi:antitoxin (DNA-binding transcriptional repressor) of toxin-antitoxin stability system